MRKSFDGLCGIISGQLGRSAMCGDVFVFINKPRNRIKLLKWEPGGFVLFYKRLERGTFELPVFKNHDLAQPVDYGELAMIITGISMRYAKKRTRFLQQNNVDKYSHNVELAKVL
ncbi:IS66 family insertion sequence element accessory protein TnpB [Patescibacteria group bacterium]|nr:IS66 family insertion sequence element accessory protein TnpB [Patescibacteria group bacterium]